MKRFLGLAAVIGLLAGVGTQAWAICNVGTNGTIGCCMWDGDPENCWGFGGTYDEKKSAAECTAASGVVVSDCEADAPTTREYCDYGPCVGAGEDEYSCGTGGCYYLAPGGTCTGGTVVTTCPSDHLPPGAGGTGGGGGDTPGTTTGGPCKVSGLFAFCGYAPYGDGAGGCYKLSNQYAPDIGKTCEELIDNCKSNYGTIYTGSTSPSILDAPPYGAGESCSDLGLSVATSVKLAGSKAATPGLKVSYAKNRVAVNWTPTAKISSGTIQLLNAKGVALSTSYIKANSGKVTAKLATVGVPAGMYFVHISAVGVNGQKIVTQSAVSIVK